MDPWSFGSEGKGLLFSDELDFPFDSFTRSKKASMEWEPKPSYSFESAESIEFTEFGFKHFHGGEVASPTCIVTPNSSLGELDELCGSVMECNSNDSSSLIDLKLGRLVDCNIAKPISKERPVMAKRPRTAMSSSSYSSKTFCQVQGCNMDLSSSKDYHKRHRVCEAHSKTSRVVVNGIEQRFCQQCSRFHLLTEFDNGKRSCRKRLAGHNERRRKPQLDSAYGKSHVFLQPVQGARFQIKFDRGSLGSPEYAVPIMNGTLQSKSFPFLHNNGRRHCSVIPLDTPSYDQELSESSNSSCALSLLSTQSQDFSSFSSGLIFPGVRADHVGGRFYSSVPNPIDINHTRSIMLPKTGYDADGKGVFLGSGFSVTKQHLPPRQGTTVDMLQLSSHLQRVEQQRSSLQIKQENEDFFGFLST